MKMRYLLILLATFFVLTNHAQTYPPITSLTPQLESELDGEEIYKWNLESFGSFDYQKEDISLRDRSAKHFKNSDGTYTAFIGAGYVHYWENQQWKTIYHSLDETSDGFKNLTNQHKTFYPKNSDGQLRTLLPDGNELKEMKNMRMYFEDNGTESNVSLINSSQGSANYNELTYNNVYNTGIDLRFTHETTTRKMDYIITSLADLGSIPTGADYLIFEEEVELPSGWSATYEDSLILVKDNTGAVKLVYEKPEFFDTPQPDQHGHAHRHEVSGDYAMIQSGNTITIQTKVPVTWLLDSDLQYPVTIDPTINLYPNNSNWWTGCLEAYSSNSSTYADAPLYSTSTYSGYNYNGEIYLGRNLTNYSLQSWAKFNISSLPSACVNSASLNYRVAYNYSNASDCVVNGRLRHLSADPVTNTWAGRLSDIRDGGIYQTFDFRCYTTGTGWVNVPMTANLDEIENAQPSGWFGVGFHTFQGGSHTTCYTEVYGHGSSSRPYLTIDYKPNYQVSFSNLSPTTLCAGQSKDISVTVTNTGCLPWTSGSVIPNTVNFSWWGNWQTGQDSNPRITPFSALAPGASQTVTFSVTAPATPGSYSIQTDLVRDGVCWFRGNSAPNCGPGNINYSIPITVLPSAASPTAINPANPYYCPGNSIDLTSMGGTAASGNIVDVWYENSCNIALEETWRTSPVPRPGWWTAGTTVNSATGVLNVTSTTNDPMIYMGNLNIDPNTYRYIQVRYRYVSGPTNPGMQVFFENGSGLAEARSQRGAMIMDGNWHYLNLDMSINYSNANSGWVGGPNITGLRFDFCEQAGMVMEFDFFLVSEDRMVSDQANLVINEGDPYYPTATTTDYYTRKIDDCGATSCVSTTVSFPPVSGFLSLNGESATCVVDENGWVQFYNQTSGRLLCAINSFGQNLGTVSATSYVQTPPFQVDACLYPQPSYNTATLGRRWVITPQFQPTNPVDVRLYYDNPEYNALSPVANSNQNTYDNTASYTDLVLSKYHNTVNPALVNSSPFDNCPSGATTLYNSNSANTANTVITGFDPNGRYNEYTIPSFSEFWLHGSISGSPLPVTLTTFNAVCKDFGIEINWTTVSESNSDYFVIEFSRDGTNWDAVDTLNAAGNSNSEKNYSYVDNNNPWTNSYYRLRQVDMDGAAVFYGPVSTSCDVKASSISVFPNPTNAGFNVNIKSIYHVEAAEMSIQNNQGKVVWSKNIQLNEGSNNFNFDHLQLESGTYIIRLSSSKEQLKPVKLVVY